MIIDFEFYATWRKLWKSRCRHRHLSTPIPSHLQEQSPSEQARGLTRRTNIPGVEPG